MAKINFIQTFVLVLCLCYGVKSRCVMRSECHTVSGFPRNCAYDGPPPPIVVGAALHDREDAIRILLHRCPEFILDENGTQKPDEDILTCCDVGQLRGMASSILIAEGVLGRCPACLKNFVRQICEMNCSPDQARFVDIDSLPLPHDEERHFVDEVFYRMHEDFMDGAFDSCSGVIVPQTGLPAVNMMCGNAPICNGSTWFGFTGDIQSNPLAPVQVNFLRTETTEDSMHVDALLCNETAEGDLPCSCIDCVSTCPVGVEPIVPDICTVFSIHCAGFATGIVYLFLTVTIVVFLAVRDYKRSNRPEPSVTTKKHNINKTTKSIQWVFSKIAAFSASNPILIIMLTTWVTYAMFFGVVRLQLTTNPVELWSAPESRSRQHLDYFNSRFGPFYRPAQVYLQMKGLSPFTVDGVTYGPAFHLKALEELVKLEDAIIDIGRNDGGVTLEEVCFAPLRQRGSEPDVDQCVSMSVSTYLSDRHNIDNETYLAEIQNCLNSFLSFGCMATWGGGAEPEIVFGGFEGDDILTADTLLINFPINNFLLEEQLIPVLEWERKFIDLLLAYEASPDKPDFVEVFFGAERSIEDEIQRVSQAEAIPIAISYVLMFIYVTIALGNIRRCSTWFVDSKIMVAIGSILVVIAAIFCGIGVLGYANITLTLLAINVIPFFVLSVGIDNVFLMVNTLHNLQYKLKEFDDYNENFSFNKKREFLFTKMMMKVGPSMFVSSVTQITCFAIGSLTNFPAVVTFSIFCSVSLGFLFVFQITTVVAILSLDYKRASQNRFDVLFCVQKKLLDDSDPLNSETPYKSIFSRFMGPYSKFILRWYMKAIIVVVFAVMICASVMMIPQIEIGLDQEMALPVDSYVHRYLQAVSGLLRLGPPVYFVLKRGLNFTDPYHQNVICGGQLCYEDSLTTQIFLASRFRDITHISRSSNSWVDDFFDWTNLFGGCCRYNRTDGSFCQSTDFSDDCSFCVINRNEWNNHLRPAEDAFQRYIPFFLQDTPTDVCNRGGLASYSSAVNYVLDSEGQAEVHDTNFMAYHTTLSTSKDFITALKYAYEISDNITNAIQKHTNTDVEVFPYSVFYVFFEQYLTMWADTFSSIGFCLIGAFVFNLIASGFNILTTFAVILTAIMVVVNMMGVMFIWNIPLNAVSCVNLIVSIGLAVEFCSHITHAFATSQSAPEERVRDALKQVGSTIITGITFTNIPIIVLAFSYTEIIEVFFFRMFFSLVILGFIHGMIFLPVLLSYLNSFKKTKTS